MSDTGADEAEGVPGPTELLARTVNEWGPAEEAKTTMGLDPPEPPLPPLAVYDVIGLPPSLTGGVKYTYAEQG